MTEYVYVKWHRNIELDVLSLYVYSVRNGGVHYFNKDNRVHMRVQ